MYYIHLILNLISLEPKPTEGLIPVRSFFFFFKGKVGTIIKAHSDGNSKTLQFCCQEFV